MYVYTLHGTWSKMCSAQDSAYKKNHIIIKSKDYVNLKDEFLYL